MKSLRFILLFLSLAFSFVAAAQTAPQPAIAQIQPDSVFTSGGTEVVILGDHLDLPPNFACVLECPPRVRFGEHEVAAHAWTDERVSVIAPPHAAGSVAVTVTTGDGRTATRPNGITYTAAPEEAWEMVLVPIHLDEPAAGANGSLWVTELWIRNSGATGVELAPWPCPAGEACLPVVPSRRGLEPGQSLHGLPKLDERSANPGRLLYVSQKELAPRISFGLRVLDAATFAPTFGTELPVVRSSELRTSPVDLLNVPYDPSELRYALRIYDTARVPTRFSVRVYEQSEQRNPSPLAEVILTANPPATDAPFPNQPSYVAFDLGSILRRDAGRALRVSIEPLEPYSRYWAFLTATNRTTQAVTLVTPQ